MKNTTLVTFTMAAALCVGGFTCFNSRAEAPARPERGGRGQIVERIKEKLDLSDDQVEKIKAELATEKETLVSLATKVHEAKVALREAIQASGATEASVRQAAAKVSTAEADMAVERFKLYGKISPILTNEQQQKLKELMGRVDEFLDNAINRMGQGGANL